MIDKSRCIVVVPVYKKLQDYNENERASFFQTYKTFGGSRQVTVLCPPELKESYAPFSRIALDKKYFTYGGYNSLCKSDWFYQLFIELGFTYMCLVQLDVWVFQDNLEYFLNKFDKRGYDYIGAPWYGVKFCKDGTVGNGGFSIRRLERFRDVCRQQTKGPRNEDVYFLRMFNKKGGIKTAPEKLALEFSFEEKPLHAFRLNNYRLPMGTHAYAGSSDRLGFWKHFISGIKEIKAKTGNPDIYNP